MISGGSTHHQRLGEASYVQSPVACARKRLAACPLQVNQIQGANLGNGFHLVDLFHPGYGCVIFVLFVW